jgi:hypothetical protein
MDENCLLMQFPPRVGTDDSSVSGSDSSGSNPSFGDEVEEVKATHHRANSPSAGETSARTEDHGESQIMSSFRTALQPLGETAQLKEQ